MVKRRRPAPPDPATEPRPARRAARKPGEPQRIHTGTGFFWSFVVGVLILAALVVLIAQNPEEVTVDWAAWDVRAPLVVVILVTTLAVSVLQAIVGLLWRRRRRRELAKREELSRARMLQPGAEPAAGGAIGVPARRDTAGRPLRAPAASPEESRSLGTLARLHGSRR